MFNQLSYAVRDEKRVFPLSRFNVFLGEEESYKSAAIEAVRLALTGKTHLGSTAQAFSNLVPRGKQNAFAELLGPDATAYWSLDLGKKGKEPVFTGKLEALDRTRIIATGLTDDLYSRPDMLRMQYLQRFGRDDDLDLRTESFWPKAVRDSWKLEFDECASLPAFLDAVVELGLRTKRTAQSFSDYEKRAALRPTEAEIQQATERRAIETELQQLTEQHERIVATKASRLLAAWRALLVAEPIVESARLHNIETAVESAVKDERADLAVKIQKLEKRLKAPPACDVDPNVDYAKEDEEREAVRTLAGILEPVYEVTHERVIEITAKVADRLSAMITISGQRAAKLDPVTCRWSISNGRTGEMFPLEASCRTARTVFKIAHATLWQEGSAVRILTLDDDDLVGLSVRGMQDLVAILQKANFDHVFMAYNRFDVEFPADWRINTMNPPQVIMRA